MLISILLKFRPKRKGTFFFVSKMFCHLEMCIPWRQTSLYEIEFYNQCRCVLVMTESFEKRGLCMVSE